MTTRRRFLTLAGAALATPALTGRAPAQAWPTRNIRAMIPFSAGSITDGLARILAGPTFFDVGVLIAVVIAWIGLSIALQPLLARVRARRR